MPDSYSKLYIYYDQHFTGFTGYSFQDGKLTKEGKTIFPDQSASADKEGKILLRQKNINRQSFYRGKENHFYNYIWPINFTYFIHLKNPCFFFRIHTNFDLL